MAKIAGLRRVYPEDSVSNTVYLNFTRSYNSGLPTFYSAFGGFFYAKSRHSKIFFSYKYFSKNNGWLPYTLPDFTTNRLFLNSTTDGRSQDRYAG